MVWRLVDEQTSAEGSYAVCARFDNAQGLITKSRVTVAGIPVGYIDRIRLEGARARVDMVIDEGVELHQDATIARRSASLLGEYILAVNPGSVDESVLEDGQCIHTVEETADTADIMQDVGAIARSSARRGAADRAGVRDRARRPADAVRAGEPHPGAGGGEPHRPGERSGRHRPPSATSSA